VIAGSPFTLTVTLSPAGAAFNTSTSLNLTASLATGGRTAGTLSPTSVIMPAGVNSATFAVAYSAVDNGVQVTVAVAKTNGKLSQVVPGTTSPFDVLKVLETFSSDNPHLVTGLGVGNADCTAASTESECGTLVLSHGFSSPGGALSLGACTPDLGCTSGSEVVQFIANLDSYSPGRPGAADHPVLEEAVPGQGAQQLHAEGELLRNRSAEPRLRSVRVQRRGAGRVR